MGSPFSLAENEWKTNWTIVPSRFMMDKYAGVQSQREKEVLKALSIAGVIGGLQLSRTFLTPNKREARKQIKRMVNTRKLVEHIIWKGNMQIPIYTLGPAGTNAIGIADNYELNYWLSYQIEDVLKRLVFYQLYSEFKAIKNAIIRPAPSPYVGAISYDNKDYYVYVVRGDTTDLQERYMWKKPLSERIVIVTERLNHLKSLEPYMSEMKVRVTVDEEIRSQKFYKWADGQWKAMQMRKREVLQHE